MKNKVVAHRDAWKEFNLPENSLSAFKKALELKCYAAEFDVHLTNDDVLVVHHDYDKEGYDIESTNYDYLAQYPLANGEKLPLLKDFFLVGFSQTTTKLMLEIKSCQKGGLDRTKHLIDCLIKMLPSTALPSLLEFIFFDFEAAIYLKNKLPNYAVHYLNGDKSAQQIKTAGLNGMDYDVNLLLSDTSLIANFKALGLKTNSFTVNDVDTAQLLHYAGIDAITTDFPQLFLNNDL